MTADEAPPYELIRQSASILLACIGKAPYCADLYDITVHLAREIREYNASCVMLRRLEDRACEDPHRPDIRICVACPNLGDAPDFSGQLICMITGRVLEVD